MKVACRPWNGPCNRPWRLIPRRLSPCSITKEAYRARACAVTSTTVSAWTRMDLGGSVTEAMLSPSLQRRKPRLSVNRTSWTLTLTRTAMNPVMSSWRKSVFPRFRALRQSTTHEVTGLEIIQCVWLMQKTITACFIEIGRNRVSDDWLSYSSPDVHKTEKLPTCLEAFFISCYDWVRTRTAGQMFCIQLQHTEFLALSQDSIR